MKPNDVIWLKASQLFLPRLVLAGEESRTVFLEFFPHILFHNFIQDARSATTRENIISLHAIMDTVEQSSAIYV
jgi:hypothetical protein